MKIIKLYFREPPESENDVKRALRRVPHLLTQQQGKMGLIVRAAFRERGTIPGIFDDALLIVYDIPNGIMFSNRFIENTLK